MTRTAHHRRGPLLLGLTLLVLLVTLCRIGEAGPLIWPAPGLERMDLQPWVELLPDPQGALRAQEARDHPGFVPNTEGTNSLGFTREALWVRFSLRATPGGGE